MVTIKVMDYVKQCYSNQDGQIIRDLLIEQLSKGNQIDLSFEKVDAITSSFVNTALIGLLEYYNFSIVKEKLRFINSRKQINEMIKKRFEFEVFERNNLGLTLNNRSFKH